MAIDWSREIETDEDSSRKARVICTDLLRSDGFTHLVAVEQYDGYEAVYCYSADGAPNASPRLRNVPEKFSREVYVNVMPDGCGYCHRSRSEADKATGSRRISCIKTTITGHVGQFDE